MYHVWVQNKGAFPMSGVKIDLMVEMLKMCRNMTLDAAKKMPEDKRLKQLKEGKATPLWLLGHMANTFNTVFLIWSMEKESMLSKELSMKFAPDFVGGTPPTTNADDYPAWDDVVALYEKAITEAIDAAKTLTDEDWDKPLPGGIPEPLREFFSSIGRVLEIMVMHDSHHRGQIGMIANL